MPKMLEMSPADGFSSVAVYERHPHQNKPNYLKTKPKPKENSQNYLKTYFLMAMISGLIPFWKLDENLKKKKQHPDSNAF